MSAAPAYAGLSPAELEQLVGELAAREELWRAHVHHDPTRRAYTELLRDQAVSAWLICWCNAQDTGFHDHDISAGAVAVLAGAVCEERLRARLPPIRRTIAAGQRFHFEPSDIHRVRHVGPTPAVTLHVYSPPLQRMGAYIVQPGGPLQRRSLPLEEELRTLSAA